MQRSDRKLVRLANAIHKRLHRPKTVYVELPATTWDRCEVLMRRMHRAQAHGWSHAAQRSQSVLRSALRTLQNDLNNFSRLLNQQYCDSNSSGLREIYRDLDAIQDEFDEVAFDLKQRTISVTTEPIELEGVYLGSFEIRLDWRDWDVGKHPHYQVIALSENPAAGDENVTHPHVKAEAVCEGEARQPLRSAWEQGRLLDFFTIVANLLRTYNPDSPYVALSDWYGIRCGDCDTVMSSDESCACSRCETDICGECYQHCCGSNFCIACMIHCKDCEDYRCDQCVQLCKKCLKECCTDCLDDQERCSDCHDEETQEPDEEPSSDEEVQANDTTIHADSLGEAAVSA